MASAAQIKELLRTHSEGNDERFYAIAMQVAAAEEEVPPQVSLEVMVAHQHPPAPLPTARFTGPRMAKEIARLFGQEPEPLKVGMKGRRDVVCLLSRTAEAKREAHTKPRRVD